MSRLDGYLCLDMQRGCLTNALVTKMAVDIHDQEDNNKEELEHAFRLGEYAHPTLLDAHAAFCTVSCQGQYVPLLISFLWNKYIKAIYVNSL